MRARLSVDTQWLSKTPKKNNAAIGCQLLGQCFMLADPDENDLPTANIYTGKTQSLILQAAIYISRPI